MTIASWWHFCSTIIIGVFFRDELDTTGGVVEAHCSGTAVRRQLEGEEGTGRLEGEGESTGRLEGEGNKFIKRGKGTIMLHLLLWI